MTVKSCCIPTQGKQTQGPTTATSTLITIIFIPNMIRMGSPRQELTTPPKDTYLAFGPASSLQHHRLLPSSSPHSALSSRGPINRTSTSSKANYRYVYQSIRPASSLACYSHCGLFRRKRGWKRPCLRARPRNSCSRRSHQFPFRLRTSLHSTKHLRKALRAE